MIKNIIAVYLIGLSVTSFALVLFIVLPYGNSVIAQQQNSTNSSEHNNISNLPLSMTDMKSMMDLFTKMRMKGPGLDIQLNLSNNTFVFNQNITICGSFICQAHLEYNIPRN
jgi:hypothetical protein